MVFSVFSLRLLWMSGCKQLKMGVGAVGRKGVSCHLPRPFLRSPRGKPRTILVAATLRCISTPVPAPPNRLSCFCDFPFRSPAPLPHHTSPAELEEAAASWEEQRPAKDRVWSLATLAQILPRRYKLRPTALEFFLTDNTNFFVNFEGCAKNGKLRRQIYDVWRLDGGGGGKTAWWRVVSRSPLMKLPFGNAAFFPSRQTSTPSLAVCCVCRREGVLARHNADQCPEEIMSYWCWAGMKGTRWCSSCQC